MSDEPDLFAPWPVEPEPTIRERFDEFAAAHPDVLHKLIELAREVKAAGKRCGIRLLWERLRWFYLMEDRTKTDGFLLNDHMHSRYSRLVMEAAPDLAGFFETRKLKGGDE